MTKTEHAKLDLMRLDAGIALCLGDRIAGDLVVIGGAKAQSGGAPQRLLTAAGPKKAEEQFKNIQALKGIPADQLIPGDAVHHGVAGRGVPVLPRGGRV